MMMPPIERQQLSGQVVERLRALVERGDYPVGSRLPAEPRLMEELGVGRSTIREAVRSLAHAGVLEVRQGSGTYVLALPSHSEPFSHSLRRGRAEEVHEARLALEQDIAYLAAMRRTPAQLETIREALKRRAKARDEDRDVAALVEADFDFHTAISRACGNGVLEDLYRTFSAVVRDSILHQMHEVGSDDIQTERHQELLNAIEAGDGARARSAVHALLERASDILRKH